MREGSTQPAFLDQVERADPAVAIVPAEARRLLRDVLAWAGGSGFPPDKAYAALEKLFGADAVNDMTFALDAGLADDDLLLEGEVEETEQAA